MRRVIKTKRELILSICGIFGIAYLGKCAGLNYLSFSIFLPFFGVLLWKIWKECSDPEKATNREEQGKRIIVLPSCISFFLSLTLIMGYQLQTTGFTSAGFLGKAKILLGAFALGTAFYPFCRMAFSRILKLGQRCQSEIANVQVAKRNIKWVFLCSVAATFICLIPVWLAYYPIIMSYDFHRQINEANRGLIWFYPLQPIAHTWIIWVFLQLGFSLGSLETGMAVFAITQMILFSLVVGYGVTLCYRFSGKKRLAVVVWALSILNPFQTVLVVCTTKDTIFTILFYLFLCLLVEERFFSGGKKRIVMEVLMVLEGALLAQFRTNAFFGLLFFAVVACIMVSSKERLRIFLLAVCLVALTKGEQAGIKMAIGTEMSAPKIEALSVPVVQFGRVGYYHGDYLKEEKPDVAAVIEKYIPSYLWGIYYAPISDGLKGSIGSDPFTEHPLQFVQDWCEVGIQFPNEYIDAFLELTRGYWFLDDRSYAENLGMGDDSGYGTLYTYTSSEIEGVGSIEHVSKFPWLEKKLNHVLNGNAYYEWPILSVFFKSAFYVWGLVILTLIAWYLRKKKPLGLCLFVLTYFSTLLFGPVVQIRYLFPVIISLPLICVTIFFSKGREVIK